MGRAEDLEAARRKFGFTTAATPEPELPKPPPQPVKPRPAAAAPPPPQYQRRIEPPASDILRRVPPQNLEAEQAVLTSVLIENETHATVAAVITEADFYRESHRLIWRAMTELRTKGDPIDILTVNQVLKSRGVFEQVGGAQYMAELAEAMAFPQAVATHARIVKEMAAKRRLASVFTELASEAYNGVSLTALIGEAERQLEPVMKDPDAPGSRGLPQLINAKLEFMTPKDLIERRANVRREWIVDQLLARKELSLWSGKVEAGKSTVMRTLVMCVARGEMFFNRSTPKGRVLYLMLDADGESLTTEEFIKLGMQPDDDIDFLIDPIMGLRPDAFARIHQRLLATTPDLCVVDPIGRFTKVDDFLSYETTYVMAQLSELAKTTGAHMALLHHIPRGRGDEADPATAAFGSIAIAGGVNARFVCCHKTGDIYTIKSSKGKGGGFQPFPDEMTVKRDPDTGWAFIDTPFDWKAQADAVSEKVFELMQSEVDRSADWIGRELGVQRSVAGVAAKRLADMGRLLMRKEGKRHLFSGKEQNQQEFDAE